MKLRRRVMLSEGAANDPHPSRRTFCLQVPHVRERRFLRELTWVFSFALLLLSGCSRLHSRAITLQLVNRSHAPVSNLALEFPGGSFGVDTVAPGATRSKWFKPLSTGPLKIDFDDQSGHHSAQLLTLSAGDSGTVVATFLGNGRVETSKSSKRTAAANP